MRLVLFGVVATVGLYAQAHVPDPLLQWMDRIAQKQLDERQRALAVIHTPAEADQRRALVRRKLLDALGGIPKYDGPLNSRSTGQIKAESYTIEKVLFESLPRYYITANVYRPNQPGRYPGVLMPAGHTQEGKPEPQIAAANLAIKGFVVLTYDPIGQGEREETFIPMLGRALSGGSVNDHVHAGAQNLLLGQSSARYFILDAKRAVDYLISRPDVDSLRLGVAGCSGGGAITTYVGTFDDRVKAAAPGCFVDSYRLLFAGPNPDSEMSLPGVLARGLDISDLLEVAAPKPWLILATEGDFFTPPGVRMVYDEARKWYGIYGAEDRVKFFIGPGPHGTPLETREQIYAWMIRWLKDGKGDPRELPVKEYTNFELQVTPTGNVQDLPHSRKLHQILQDDYRAKKSPRGLAELKTELQRLGIASTNLPPFVTVLDESNPGDYRLQHIRFTSEPEIEILGKLYIPRSTGRKPAVLLVEDQSMPVPLYVSRSKSTEALAIQLVRKGQVVLEMLPRDCPSEFEGRPFVGNWLCNEQADQIGRNLAAMRAHDLLRGVDLLASRDDVNPASIRGAARSVKGVWLLLAAAVDPRLSKLWLDRVPHSLESSLELPIGAGLYDAVIPGFLLHWDLKDLVSAMGGRSVLWTDPMNWMRQKVALGPPFAYRHTEETDEKYIAEFLK